MSRIFISYRRDDSAGYAGRLYDRLFSYFGSEEIFIDVGSIEPGQNFVTTIEAALGSCKVLLAVVGKDWLKVTDTTGRRKLDDPDDFVRLEIATALDRNIRIIPILVGGATMPSAHELPPKLIGLSRCHAFELSNNRFQYDTRELIKVLEKILELPIGGSVGSPTQLLHVQCAGCGTSLGQFPAISGKFILTCALCEGKTVVEIHIDGSVSSYQAN